jgi:pilus assembly protein Flp/PilA
MRAFLRLFTILASDRKGATAVEYGFILALMVLALMVGVRALGGANKQVWDNVSEKVQRA